jgi:hypothetical protein
MLVVSSQVARTLLPLLMMMMMMMMKRKNLPFCCLLPIQSALREAMIQLKTPLVGGKPVADAAVPPHDDCHLHLQAPAHHFTEPYLYGCITLICITTTACRCGS